MESVDQAVTRSSGADSGFETVSTVREAYRGKRKAELDQGSNVKIATPAVLEGVGGRRNVELEERSNVNSIEIVKPTIWEEW